MNPVATYFSKVPDPRVGSNAQVHLLVEILTIAVCAMLSGAESFADMERFGQEKCAWLKSRLGLRLHCGVPSHDTFGRIFAALDAHAFGAAMQTWTQALHQATEGRVVALDGKTVRRSFDSATGKGAIHLVSAWASDCGLVLGQCKVEGKSNEITAVPKLLELLDVRGCIVTADALNTQKSFAAQIIAQKADYVLALKHNHALLHQEVQEYFAWCQEQPDGLSALCEDCVERREWGHGRAELRRCFVVGATEQDWPRACGQWPGLQTLVMVESTRATGVGAQTKTSVERRFFLSSAPPQAELLLCAVRAHWGVENNVHWCLDVAFDEDGCRVRKDNAPENLGTLRRLCLNLLRQEESDKRGLKAKRLRAAWNSDFLLSVLIANKS